jgi:hypothetical protein
MAAPMSVARRRLPDPRLRTALSWLAAAALIVVVAFVVALPGTDEGGTRATPSAAGAPTPLPIQFGTTLDAQTGDAIGLTERFAPGDTFAYSVRPTGGLDTETVHVEVLREAADGLSPVQTPAPHAVLPESGVIAFEVPADGLISAFGEGSFLMRIYLDPAEAPLAEGRFRLVAAPVESPAP